MKYKHNFVFAGLFLLVGNTAYYWEGVLGVLVIPGYFILFCTFVVLAIMLFRHLYRAIREKFSDKYRVGLLIFVAAILFIVVWRPGGVIDFDALKGRDLLVAYRDGAAGCGTTLKLKEGGSFTERSVCFGVENVKGKYLVVKDTIFFDSGDYKYALVGPVKMWNGEMYDELVITKYEDKADTSGFTLEIKKNELLKKKP